MDIPTVTSDADAQEDAIVTCESARDGDDFVKELETVLSGLLRFSRVAAFGSCLPPPEADEASPSKNSKHAPSHPIYWGRLPALIRHLLLSSERPLKRVAEDLRKSVANWR